jgi:hypothetical protein
MDEEALDRYLLGVGPYGDFENNGDSNHKIYIKEYNRTVENNHRKISENNIFLN